MSESVWILFLTFRRTIFALRTIRALKEHLFYENLHWHVCDDGSQIADDGTERSHIEVLTERIGGDVTWHDMGTPWGQFNAGGNANQGIRIAQEHGCNQYFIVHDDSVLLDDLDLTPYVGVLKENPQAGFIRFCLLVGGMSGIVTGYRATGRMMAFLRLIRKWCMENPWHSDSYVHAFQPALVHRRFYDAYGYYPENKTPGNTETGMCSQYNYSPLGEDGPQILWPMDLWPRNIRWFHFGLRAVPYKTAAGGDGKDGTYAWDAIH